MAFVDCIKDKVLTTILLVLTVLIGIGGLTFIICGTCFIVQYGPYDQIFKDANNTSLYNVSQFTIAGAWTIGSGVVLIVPALLGCVAVFKKEKCPRIYYLVTLLLVAAMLFYFFSDNVSNTSTSSTEREGLHQGAEKAVDDTFQGRYKLGNQLGGIPTPPPGQVPVPPGRSVLRGQVPALPGRVPEQPGQVPEQPRQVPEQPRQVPELPGKVPPGEVPPGKVPDVPEVKTVDLLQEYLECCGSDGPKDFEAAGEFPRSCCKQLDGMGQCPKANAFKEGCKKKLVDSLRKTASTQAGFYGFFFLVTCAAAVTTSLLICICCKRRAADSD